MENSSDQQPRPGKLAGLNLYILGFALLATLAAGVAIGLLINRPAADNQIVVTATPDPGSQTLAQATAQNASEASGDTNSPPTPTIMDFVLSDARHFQGSPDAPVTLVELSDFKCPFCGRFATETLSRIREQYIDPGKVRFTYKHFAILGPESNRAAEASECAAEQDKFWEYHDRLFADQTTTRSTLSDERLIELGVEVGLDPDALGECLNSGRYTSKVRQESLSVQSMGIRGTPAFLINGTFISGAQPFEVFQQVIEEQLGNPPTQANQPPATQEPAGQTSAAQEPASLDDGIDGTVSFPDLSLDHVDGEIEYPQPVPPGGKHSAAWQNCGIYSEPVPTEPIVHSLEHGAVWVAYQSDLPAGQVEILRELVRQAWQTRGEALVLLAPLPTQSPMDAPIVVTAWRVQLQLEDAADERLVQFLDRYQNGPFAPEPGAPCSGSVGEPLEF